MSVTIIEERGLGAARRPSFHESCLVVVPALNDQETVADVVLELRAQGFEHIRVVDSGSIDATPERARTAGAEVFGADPIRILPRLPARTRKPTTRHRLDLILHRRWRL